MNRPLSLSLQPAGPSHTWDADRPATILGEIATATRHSMVYGLGNIVAKAAGFLMLPFYTRYLSPSDYGVLEILDLSMSLFGMLLNMGMTSAVLRCYAVAKSAKEAQLVVSTGLIFTVITGALTAIVGLTFLHPVSIVLLGPDAPIIYLSLSFGSFILSYIVNLPRTYLRALEASGVFTVIDTGSVFVMLALNIYFIAVLKIGLLGILWSSFLVMAVQFVLLSIWTIRKVGLRFSPASLRQMVAFGVPLILSNLSMFALNFSDRFFLKSLRSLHVVGIYAVGYKVAFMLSYFIVLPFGLMWQSRMYLIAKRGDHELVFRQLFVFYSMVLIAGGLALSVLSPEIMRVMVGQEFSSAKEIIPIVTLGYIFYGLGEYLQTGLFLANRPRLIGLVGVGAACLDLTLNYILILHYGMYGAASATAISFLALSVAGYCFADQVHPMRLGVLRVCRGLLLACAVFFVSRIWVPQSLSGAVVVKVFWLALFPLLIWKSRVLAPDEVETVETAWTAMRQRVGLAAGTQQATEINT